MSEKKEIENKNSNYIITNPEFTYETDNRLICSTPDRFKETPRYRSFGDSDTDEIIIESSSDTNTINPNSNELSKDDQVNQLNNIVDSCKEIGRKRKKNGCCEIC